MRPPRAPEAAPPPGADRSLDDRSEARDSRERVAFPVLEDGLIARLRPIGSELRTQAGDVLWTEGDRAYDFFVVLEGAVRIVETSSLEGPRRCCSRWASARTRRRW